MAKSTSVRDLLNYAVEHRVSIATAAQKLKASDAVKERARDLRVEIEEKHETLDYWETVSEVLKGFK